MRRALAAAAIAALLAGCQTSPTADIDFTGFEKAAVQGTAAEVVATLPSGEAPSLTLEIRYRLPGADWGAWKRVGELEPSGGQARIRFDPEWPKGFDEIGKEAMVRVMSGTRVVATSKAVRLRRVEPIWDVETRTDHDALGAGEGLVCYGAAAHLYCLRQDTGDEDFRLDLPTDARIRAVAVAHDRVYLAYNTASDSGTLWVYDPATQTTEVERALDFEPTTLLVTDDAIYVGGTRSVPSDDWVEGCEGDDVYTFRMVVEKFGLDGTPVAGYVAGATDMQEDDAFCNANNSSALALYQDGNELIVAYAFRHHRQRDTGRYGGCLGFARLDAKSLTPLAPKAFLFPDDDRCSGRVRGRGRWFALGSGSYLDLDAPIQPAVALYVLSGDYDPTRRVAHASYMGGSSCNVEAEPAEWADLENMAPTSPPEDLADLPFQIFSTGGDFGFTPACTEDTLAFLRVVRSGDRPEISYLAPGGYDFLALGEANSVGITRLAEDPSGPIFLGTRFNDAYHLLRLR